MHDQLSLDALPLPDPGAEAEGRHHKEGHDTEHDAAAAIRPVAGTWRQRVLRAIADSGEEGRTDWEIHQETGGVLYTIAPRRTELARDGWIVDSGRRRATNTGTNAIVWVLTDRGREELRAGGLHP